MVINIPTGSNVVVLSNYRTGSTALCDIISKKNKLTNLDEVFHSANWKTNCNKIHTNSSYVIKIMPDHFDHPEVQSVIKNAFVIGITRKNIYAQITSFYICHVTKFWHYVHNQPVVSYTVPIDKHELENQIRYITNMDLQYRDLVARYAQQEFYYEDIVDDLVESKFKIYHRPDNYQQIYQSVIDLYDQCI